MQILEIEVAFHKHEVLQYRVWFEANGAKWYMYIDQNTFYNPKNFKKWLETIIEDVKLRT